jgi:hypothetical protein
MIGTKFIYHSHDDTRIDLDYGSGRDRCFIIHTSHSCICHG